MEKILLKLNKKENLSFKDSTDIFEEIMTGKINEEHLFKFLTLLSSKGETAEEIAGGVNVLRNKAKRVNVDSETIDTCGTGGDGADHSIVVDPQGFLSTFSPWNIEIKTIIYK